MEPQIVPFMLNLLATNLGFTLSYIVLFMLHFWAFALYLRRGQREAQQSLERIEASNERITQMAEHVATMVRDLPRR